MIMPSRIRKIALTVHITSTLSWLGAIAGFLALAIAGLRSNDVQLVRSTYLADGIDWMVRARSVMRSLLVNRAHRRRLAVETPVVLSSMSSTALKQERATRAPRWVYVPGIHAIGLAVLFMIIHLSGGVPGH
jgi:hypothetical protein